MAKAGPALSLSVERSESGRSRTAEAGTSATVVDQRNAKIGTTLIKTETWQSEH